MLLTILPVETDRGQIAHFRRLSPLTIGLANERAPRTRCALNGDDEMGIGGL